MPLMGVRELARHLKVSPGAVDKATKSGRIAKIPDPSVPSSKWKYDSDQAASCWTRHTDPAMQRRTPPRAPDPVKVSAVQVLDAAPIQAPAALRNVADWSEWSEEELRAAEQSILADIQSPGSIEPEEANSFSQFRTLREIESYRESRIRREALAGKYVEKAGVAYAQEAIAAAVRNALLAQPSKRAAEVAAELGIDDRKFRVIWERENRLLLIDLTQTADAH